MNIELTRAFGAAIAEKLMWPPAFEIPAAPHIHAVDMRQFERAIDPSSTAPARRPHVPIRMIIERNNRERPCNATNPQRR